MPRGTRPVALIVLFTLTFGTRLAVRAQGVAQSASAPWSGSVHLQGGHYSYAAVPSLPRLDGAAVWSLGLTAFPGSPLPSHTIGLDFYAWGLSRSYQSVLSGAAESETTLRTAAFALGTRVGLPPTLPVGVYALAGRTYVNHHMSVDLRPSAIFPDLPNRAEDEDGGWAPYWGYSVEARYRRFALGVQQRWINSTATFDRPFSMSELELGGSTVLLGLSLYLEALPGL